MAAPSTLTVTTGGAERVERACEVYKKAFVDDAVFRYILSHLGEEERNAYLGQYFKPLMKASAMAQGAFDEVDNFSSMTVLIPPGKRMDNYFRAVPAGLVGMMLHVGPKAAYRMMVEWSGKAAATKKKGLKGTKKYWYVFFVGTDPACQGRGLGGTLVRDAQRRAQADGVPAWIEATSEGSYRLYAKCGFELVDVMRLGKGHTGSDGRPKEGGEGVPVWALVWWPKKEVAATETSPS